ncbi:uncharacterized protein B0I36DRAFT_13359 [Microdochium trichocladiopsis]|uniref:Uncharacterized protein n=1 Tax=Microdochium trichocladiopsis TaxID=1682393 RepID=A0A9P8YIJ2_9PEZI|nr:uncharacterized protein B0I36DRAFT_13359 [Microdochium trichocladiopsis]KAH7040642.1 hypothetical protein B0I36DRAFT_13359 [Microdochium trichocladiopsis]
MIESCRNSKGSSERRKDRLYMRRASGVDLCSTIAKTLISHSHLRSGESSYIISLAATRFGRFDRATALTSTGSVPLSFPKFPGPSVRLEPGRAKPALNPRSFRRSCKCPGDKPKSSLQMPFDGHACPILLVLFAWLVSLTHTPHHHAARLGIILSSHIHARRVLHTYATYVEWSIVRANPLA